MRLIHRLQEVATGAAAVFGAECAFRFIDRYPATVNDPRLAELTAAIASELVGPAHVVRDLAVMASEDMSCFLQRIPGCYVFVGAGNEARGLAYPHHSPHFDFDEGALPLGCELFLRIVERWFERVPPAASSAR